ncbi:hypothetical protein [Deinococcus puniceus]|uniref:hypothetical protein n=1 Tax=Deinococcus puniceus TaxID=1182568 RepID=UPI000A497C3D|nr:hypothetical protein [Deinococcus puniceus]
MTQYKLAPEEIELLKSAASTLKVNLSKIETAANTDSTDFLELIDDVFAPFYQSLYNIIMSSQLNRGPTQPPPLDSTSYIDYAKDILDLRSATTGMINTLSSSSSLTKSRTEFPNEEMGEVCFTLARVLWHLADFQFPTKGRFQKEGQALSLSLDGEEVHLKRSSPLGSPV